jgi:hypothetical protein
MAIVSFVVMLTSPVAAFSVGPSAATGYTTPTTTALRADSWDGAASGGAGGSIEQIEFKIYADGRVEETVRGVKGNNCHSVTEKINEKLGKVVTSSPTEEMFEEKVEINQKLYQSESDWDGSSSW